MKTSLRSIVLAMCVGTTACATMVNPGKIAPAQGGSGRTARLRLGHPRGLQAIYADGRQLEVRDEADQAFHVKYCRTYRESNTDAALGWVTVDGNCMNAILFPYVELDKSAPHTIRVVTNRGEATTTVKSHMHIQWFWLNGVWFAAAPIGWAVDLASGRMNYFSGVDVADLVDRSRGTR